MQEMFSTTSFVSKLTRIRHKQVANSIGSCLFHTSCRRDERPLKFKNVPVYTFANKSESTQKSTNRLYVWGFAGTGALGEPEFLDPKNGRLQMFHQRKPWRLRWADRINVDPTHVACGNGFSLICIKNSKTLKGHNLFGTGMNTESQIGVHQAKNGKLYKYVTEPMLIDLPIEKEQKRELKILDVSCGRAHSVVLTSLGVFSFGNNSYGQCARPIVDNEQYFGNRSVIQNVTKYFPTEKSDEIISVKAGQDHTCFLTRSGSVLTCGWAADGQLGQDIFTVSSEPRHVKGDIQGERITELASKGDFVLALSEKGELFGWGNNEYKQLAMCGTNEPQIGISKHLKIPNYVKAPILKVAASGTHCLIIDSDYNVWTWGYGLLGKGPKCDELAEPSMIPNTLFGCYPEIQHSMSRKASSVHCGLNSSAVIYDDGMLYMWGHNKYGNLGIGEKNDIYFPLRVNLPARVKKIDCGPDQTFAICNTNI